MKSICITNQTSTRVYWGPEKKARTRECRRETNKHAVHCFCFVGLPGENAEATVAPARWRHISAHSSLLDERVLQDGSSFIRLPACRGCVGMEKTRYLLVGGMNEEAPEREEAVHLQGLCR